MTIQAYPLQWPAGWERMLPGWRTTARFGKASCARADGGWDTGRPLTIAEGASRLRLELSRMGVQDDDLVISSNLVLRLDGMPRSDQREPDDPGVAVYWRDHANNARCIAVDRYDRAADNMAAIAATLEAMRAIERHGGAEILDRAYSGFTGLPDTSGGSWWAVLGVAQNASSTEVELAYKRLRSQHHPDRSGGDAERFNAVQRAYEEWQRI